MFNSDNYKKILHFNFMAEDERYIIDFEGLVDLIPMIYGKRKFKVQLVINRYLIVNSSVDVVNDFKLTLFNLKDCQDLDIPTFDEVRSLFGEDNVKFKVTY